MTLHTAVKSCARSGNRGLAMSHHYINMEYCMRLFSAQCAAGPALPEALGFFPIMWLLLIFIIIINFKGVPSIRVMSSGQENFVMGTDKFCTDLVGLVYDVSKCLENKMLIKYF